jgi:hypothetical protein
MLQRFVDELVDKYVIPFATVDEKVLSVGIRNGQVHTLHTIVVIPSGYDNVCAAGMCR